jgi:hypothetical protein
VFITEADIFDQFAHNRYGISFLQKEIVKNVDRIM